MISVIMPVHNEEKFIKESIKSVRGQSFSDWELIVVDDASSDKTLSIIGSFNDSRIKVVSHNLQQGVSAARNTGLNLATGEYIAFIDADDCWYPNKLQLQYDLLSNKQHVAATYCLIERIDREGNVIFCHKKSQSLSPTFEHLAIFNPIKCGSTIMIRRSMLTRANTPFIECYFNQELCMAEDLEFWLRVHFRASQIGCSIEELPMVLCRYRLHPLSTGAKSSFSHNKKQLIQIFMTSRDDIEWPQLTQKQCLGFVASNLTASFCLSLFYNSFFRNITSLGRLILYVIFKPISVKNVTQLVYALVLISLLPILKRFWSGYSIQLFSLRVLFRIKNALSFA